MPQTAPDAVVPDGAEPVEPETTEAKPVQTPTRPEIQALRAIAVLAVVAFHLWPSIVPGGYVGVDIFFVISGYLITSHLLREVVAKGRVRLAAFWGRRIRRLLPASLVVIAASVGATLLWAPQGLWTQYAQEFSAAATYWLNWLLAFNSVDYLAADNTPSPVQHYWSLSTEEQFYIVWPLLISLGVLIAFLIKRVSMRAAIAVILVIVTVASLVYCIFLTNTDPSPAYFVTPTRAWEFGIGGLLALVGGRGARKSDESSMRLPVMLSWIGLVAIVVTLFAYTPKTQFPGWEALLPVLGTLAVIGAGSPEHRFSTTRFLSVRPVQWLGDVSYSFYLWHWPPIVLLPFVLGAPLETWTRFAIFFGSLVLAVLTKRFVEDPVRRGKWLNRRTPYLSIAFAALAMVAVVAASSGLTAELDKQVTQSLNEVKKLEKSGTDCFGAAAADPADQPCVNHELDNKIFPDRASGEKDSVVPDGMTCRAYATSYKVLTCHIVKGTKLRVALVGDSHAEHWIPAATVMAKARGWQLDTFLKGGCPFSAADRIDAAGRTNPSCVAWNSSVLKKLEADRYDLVLTSSVTGVEFAAPKGLTSMQAGIIGLAKQWEKLEKVGIRVIAIRDDPIMRQSAPVCLSALGNRVFTDSAKCGRPENIALREDPQVRAAEKSSTPIVDLTPFFCQKGFCPAVVGSVVVYRDDAHMGGTFSRTLGPFLGKAVDKILKGP